MTGLTAGNTRGDRADLCGVSDWLPAQTHKMGNASFSFTTNNVRDKTKSLTHQSHKTIHMYNTIHKERERDSATAN